MFNLSYTPVSSGIKRLISVGFGSYLVIIHFQGSNNEHWSLHAFQSSGQYAKSLNTIANFNYSNNSSAKLDAAESGVNGFYITATFTNLSGVVNVILYQLF